jgi:hypothetical protein
VTDRAGSQRCVSAIAGDSGLLGPIAIPIVLVGVLCFVDGAWLGGLRLPDGNHSSDIFSRHSYVLGSGATQGGVWYSPSHEHFLGDNPARLN